MKKLILFLSLAFAAAGYSQDLTVSDDVDTMMTSANNAAILSNIGADAAGTERPPTAHASEHTDGTDDIQDATNAQKGLATAAQITAVEANTVHISSDGADHTSVVLQPINEMQFDVTPTPGAYTAGVMRWNPTDATIEVDTGVDGVTLQFGQEMAYLVRNDTGSTIFDGEVIRITGVIGQKPTVTQAQADSVANAFATVAVATQDIPNNTDGFVTSFGRVRDFDTSAFSAGDIVWLSDTVAGGFTTVKPDIPIAVGVILVSHPTLGVLGVQFRSQISTYQLASDPSAVGGFSASEWISDLSLDTATLTFTNKTLTDFSNEIHADSVHAQGRNVTGSTITSGSAVYISGYNIGADLIQITDADANLTATMPAVGVVQGDITNGSNGHIVISGQVHDIDTSGTTIGDDLYVSETAGELTATKPQNGAEVQKMAVVLRVHATLGIIDVVGAGRSNDLPNLASDTAWIGDTNGVPAEVTVTTYAQTILDDADAATARATLETISISSSDTLTNKDIDGDNNTLSNLDIGNEVDWAAADDVTTRSAFASGDKVLIFEAGVGMRKVDYDDLPGAGGGLSNIVEDTTPQLGGMLDVNTFSLGDGTLELLSFIETGSAINEITITNAATGNGPTLSATGDDTDIDLNLVSKGAGAVNADGNRVLTTADEGTGNGLDADTLDGQEGTYYLARANHTGTQAASTISDFDTEVANNSAVTANTAKVGLDAAGNNEVQDIEVTGEAYADAEVDDGNSSTADTIDFTTGNFHKSTLTDNVTYTFTAPSGATTLVFKLVQDGTGSRLATWPATVKWSGGTAPTLTTAAASIDIISFYYDGTSYYGSPILDLQ